MLHEQYLKPKRSTKRRRVLSHGDNVNMNGPPPDPILPSNSMPNGDFGDTGLDSDKHLAGSFRWMSIAIGYNQSFPMADNPRAVYDPRGPINAM